MTTAPPGAPKRRHLTSGQRQNRAGLAFVTPTFLVVLVVVIIPILWTVLLAFQNARLVDIQGMSLFGQLVPGQLQQGLRLRRILVQPQHHTDLHRGSHRRIRPARPDRGAGPAQALPRPRRAARLDAAAVRRTRRRRRLRLGGGAQPAVRHRQRVGLEAPRLGRPDRVPVHPLVRGERPRRALRHPPRAADRHRLRDMAVLPLRLPVPPGPAASRPGRASRRPPGWTAPPRHSGSATYCCRS